MTLTIDQKLDRILDDVAALRRSLDALTAIKAAKDDTADHMNTAAHALMARNARRATGLACPQCNDVGLVYDALGAIPCPVCSPCIQGVDGVPSHAAERDRP